MSLSAVLLSAVLLLLCVSCRSNEFKLEGKIEGGEASTLYLSWRAASGKQDFMVNQAVPLASSGFRMGGPVKYPTVMWVFSSGRQLLTSIYIERGDELSVQGEISEPWLWQVSGNEVMEEVSSWELANRQVLKTPRGSNKAVSEYVKAHPGSRAALFLLYTRYDRSIDQKEFDRMLSSFTDREMVEEMRRACLEPDRSTPVSLPKRRRERIDSVLNADSQDTVINDLQYAV